MKEWPDLYAAVPLERAYLWVLGTEFERDNSIELGRVEVHFDPKDITPGRCVAEVRNGDCSCCWMNGKNLKEECSIMGMKGGWGTHPRSDIFFLDRVGRLVLIEITGSGNAQHSRRGNVGDTVNKLRALVEYCMEVDKREAIGIVLAPNILPEAVVTVVSDENAMDVVGKDAEQLLGGLKQIRRWMTESGRD